MASSTVLILLVVLCGLCEIVHSHKKNHTRRDPEEEYKAVFDSINEKVKFPIPAKKQQGSRSGSSSDEDDDDFGGDGEMFKIFTSMSGSLVPAACQNDADCKEGGLVCSRFLGKCVAPGKQQNGTCVRAQVCNGDSDCCPGETCDNYSGLLTINRCREGNSSASVAVSSDSAKAALKPTANGQSKSAQSGASSESAASSESVQPNAAKVSVSSSKKDKGPMGAKRSKAGYPTVPLEAPAQPPQPTDQQPQTDIQPEVQPVPEKAAKPVSVKGSAAAQSSTGQKNVQVDVVQPADAAPANVAVNNDTGAVSVNVPGASALAAGSASKASDAAGTAQGGSAGDEAEGSGQEVDAANDAAAAAKPAVAPEQNDKTQIAQSASSGPNAQAASGAVSSSSSGQNGNGLKGKSKAMPLVEPIPEPQVQIAPASEPAAPAVQNPENPNEIELSLMQAGTGGIPPKVLLSAKTSIVRNKSRSKNRASSADTAAGPNNKNDGSSVIPPAVKTPY